MMKIEKKIVGYAVKQSASDEKPEKPEYRREVIRDGPPKESCFRS